MTKKHFEAIAGVISNHWRGTYNQFKVPSEREVTLMNSLADYFERENPRFDRERFMKACGVCEGKHKTVEELFECPQCEPFFDKKNKV